MLTTIIIGTAFVAMLQLVAAGSVNNIEGAELTTGISLARNIREYTLTSTWANLPTFNGANYSPPKDSRGVTLTNITNWQQQVTVQAVNPDDITQDIVDPSPTAVRISVVVSHNNERVCDLSWYVFDGTP
jgi:hypothetical protein